MMNSRTGDQWLDKSQRYDMSKIRDPVKYHGLSIYATILELLAQADMVQKALPEDLSYFEDNSFSGRGWEFYWDRKTERLSVTNRESMQTPTLDTERATNE